MYGEVVVVGDSTDNLKPSDKNLVKRKRTKNELKTPQD